MNLPKLLGNFISHLEEFMLHPAKARAEDRTIAYILTIALGFLTAASISLLTAKVIHKSETTLTETDKKVDHKAQKSFSNSPLNLLNLPMEVQAHILSFSPGSGAVISQRLKKQAPLTNQAVVNLANRQSSLCINKGLNR